MTQMWYTKSVKKRRTKNMTQTQLINQIKELNEYEALLAEVKAQAEAIKDSIKAEMDMLGTEELTVGTYIVRYTTVLSNRFDTTSFKKSYSEIYKAYTKTVSSKRFSITC